MRIGVSLRVDTVPDYQEVRDGLDHQWIPFLESVGLKIILIPNLIQDPKAYYEDLNLEGLVLTGGNDPEGLKDAVNLSVERDRTELAMLERAKELEHPVIGVCRGMQLLCLQSEEELHKIKGHVGTRHSIQPMNGFSYPSNLEVNSYHNWALLDLKNDSPWLIQAKTLDGSIEAIRHKSEALLGIMWHPERELQASEHDIRIFKEFISND